MSKRMGFRVVPAVVGLGMVLSLLGCGTAEDPWPPGKPRVLVSFPPLYCFAKNVAGDKPAVMSLLTTTGPHGFEAGQTEALKIDRADVFLANGLGLDKFVATAVATSH